MVLRYFVCCLLAVVSLAFFYNQAGARSALSPRHSGIEPPGGPRPIEGLPGNSPSRTAEGGMGYTDAYGNTVTYGEEAEVKEKPRRPSPGAYGGYGKKTQPGNLPEPAGPPIWEFQKKKNF